MLVGGFEKLTLIDYPGEVAAIVFTRGCNFRCPFCYNPMLVVPNEKAPSREGAFSEDYVLNFLKDRKGKLDGVVISGGEPTLQKDLIEFILKLKALNYKVKLDTNGTNPEILKNLINQKIINYVAMDLKAPLEKYSQVVKAPVDLNKITESIKILINSKMPYEFRTTVVPKLISKNDINLMGVLIQNADRWFLQNFQSQSDLVDLSFQKENSFTDQEMLEMLEIGKKYVKKCEVR